MEATTQEPSEKLIEEMLGFLDSTSEEEEEDECVMSSCEKSCKEMDIAFDSIPKKERKPKTSIAVELKKIQSQFPIWHCKENASTSISAEKKMTDEPIWEENYALIPKDKSPVDDQEETDWNSKLESNCRRSGNSYVQEVNRAIYGDTTGHPPYGSADYYQMAQNYAIYGKDFLDFPENLTPLLSEKVVNSADATAPFAACGNGLYPTPTTTSPDLVNGMAFGNYNKQSGTATAAATTSSYYQLCNGIQPTVRPAACSTAYGMFLGNKVTYVAAAPTAPQLVYNQHSSTATNFISNSLANAALATSPAILYSNPMLTTTTQQYLNTFLKETQYLSCGAQGTAVGAASTTGIYERLVYAQMLQQQIYHQTQQQAAAVAAMFQHKTQRPQTQTRATNGTSASAATLTGLNLCARQAQAAMASSIPTGVTTPIAAIPVPANGNGNGNDDSNPTSLGD